MNAPAQAAMRLLARSTAPSTAALFIETLSREIGSDGGELWLIDDDDDRGMRLAGAWYADDIDDDAIREAAATMECRAYEPWIETIDPAASPRASELAKAGIRSAISVPMLARETLCGMLVFLNRSDDVPKQSLLDELSTIASVSAVVWHDCRATRAAADADAELVTLADTKHAVERHASLIRHLAAAAEAGGANAFDVMARELAGALGTDAAVIAVIEAGNRVHHLGTWSRGKAVPRVVWNLAPRVATMIGNGSSVTGNVDASSCSEPAVLEMELAGYAAAPLIDSRGEVFGFAAALSREAISPSPVQHAALRIIAGRAAAEVERLRLEKNVAAANDHARSLAAAIEDGVITIDGSGAIVTVTDAVTAMFGYSRDELTGANVSLLMPEPYASRHDNYLSRYVNNSVAQELTVRRDVTGRRKDGSALPLRLTVIEHDAGSRRLFDGIVRDLSEGVDLRRELQRSRGIVADTQRLTHIGNWVWDLTTGEMEWSEEIFRIFGRSRSDFTPSFAALLNCIHPDDRSAVEAAVEEGLRNGENGSEHRVIRPDGTEVTVNARGEVQFEDERPVRIIGTAQDITDRRNATERLARLSSAIEQTADQVMITDRDGRIEYVNPAFEQATGYSREMVAGQTPSILKSGSHSMAFYRNVWTTLLSGNVCRGVFVNRRRDGTIMYEEKTIAPIRRADGTITHFVSTGRDIGERMRVEKEQENLRNALSLSAAEWRLTFDAIDFPVFVCGSDSVVRRVNSAAQKLSGIPFGELIGRRLEDFPRCQPWVGAAEMVAGAAAGEAVSTQVREPVSNRTWEITATPFHDGPIGSLVIFVARDLTHLLELQESLRRTEVMSTLGALVAGVAHEVRNPLFAISATIDAFEGRALNQAVLDDYTTRLRVELERLKELMADLLEYGRPSDPDLRLGTLRAPIEQALRSTAALTVSLDVTVDASMTNGETEVMLDERRLSIALRNLLDNAIRHSPRGGRVDLHIERRPDWVDIVIRDRGEGFGEDDLPHLFEPFFTRRRGGTGLGLSIVYRTIEQHGGSIIAENHPDGGALMRVRLPLAGD